MYGNIFYFDNLNAIGGVETYLYEMARKYHKWDITIFYKTGNKKQLDRLKKYVRVQRYLGQEIECKKAFFAYNADIIEKVKADEYIEVIHTDYKNINMKPFTHPKITKYIGVSQVACDSFTALTGIPCELCYNPFTKEEISRRPLILISAQRLTAEKGKDRIIKLDKELRKHNVPYIWFIFTNDKNSIKSPNIVYVEPRLDIRKYYSIADFFVQLSDDCEGFGYSPIEAITAGVPCILTPCRVYKELGITGNHAIFVDFDMEKIPIDEIMMWAFDSTRFFEYEPPKDNYEKLLCRDENTYDEEKNQNFTVSATPIWEQLGLIESSMACVPKVGQQWVVDYDRMKVLTSDNLLNLKLVDVIGPTDVKCTSKEIKGKFIV